MLALRMVFCGAWGKSHKLYLPHFHLLVEKMYSIYRLRFMAATRFSGCFCAVVMAANKIPASLISLWGGCWKRARHSLVITTQMITSS